MKNAEKASEIKDLGKLLFNTRPEVRVVNLITLYRIITFPLLVIMLFAGNHNAFKWLLLASFFTDAIDGFLARKYEATSVLGAKLDSIGDDLTVLAATAGLFIYRFDFVKEERGIFLALLALFLVQVTISVYRYKKISTFHTYLAKIAAIITALFLLSVFFVETIYYALFYAAAIVTALELVEEVILAAILRDYRSNVKGLYWVLRANRR